MLRILSFFFCALFLAEVNSLAAAPPSSELVFEYNIKTREEGANCKEIDPLSTLDEEEGDCVTKSTVIIKKLPWSKKINGTNISISKDRKIEVQRRIGDADASASMATQIPDDRYFKDLGKPFEFSLSGGEYASGSWSIQAEFTVSISKK